jgi:hypothetical protein
MGADPLVIANDHAAALDILLLLADSRAGSSEFDRALDLLAEAERAGCALSAEYELKRRTWEIGALQALGA